MTQALPTIFAAGTTRIGLLEIDRRGTRREAEQEAVRRLLEALAGQGARLTHDADGMPFIFGSDLHISISHSREFAAVAVDRTATVGIDIESRAREHQLSRVAPRVLSSAELDVYSALHSGYVRAWTIKEALYKVAGDPGIDWRRDLELPLGETKHARAGAHACEIIYSASHDCCWLTVVRHSLIP